VRYGIISDIHGNIEALEASLRSLEAEKVDEVVCLGDIVGYGANPAECIALVRETARVVILGNHDAAVAGRMDYSYYYDAARDALDWCKKNLVDEDIEWLAQRPYNYRIGGIDFCHGSPIFPEEFEYIFTREKAKELLPHLDDLADVTFIGHSHLTKSFALSKDEAYNVRGTKFMLRDQYKYIITAGSVGQPRDYDPRSCSCIYDTEEGEFAYIRTTYDIEAQMKKIVDAGLAYNFGARLLVGI
jgi:predicted phosphodiesterase